MLIYEAKVVYSLIQLGDAVALSRPALVVDYLHSGTSEFPVQETAWLITVDTRLRPHGRTLLSIGSINQTVVSPVTVFRTILLQPGAAGFYLAHTHPSGDSSPSHTDQTLTRLLAEASRLMNVTFHDHVIIGHPAADPNRKGYFSFREAGLM